MKDFLNLRVNGYDGRLNGSMIIRFEKEEVIKEM
jgi:hypothetical protein